MISTFSAEVARKEIKMATGGDTSFCPIDGKDEENEKLENVADSEDEEKCEGEEKCVADSEYQALLTKHAPDLLVTIQVKPLKAHLFKHKVVDEIAWQTIEARGPAFEKVDALIEHVMKGDIRRYRGFLQSLRDSYQGHIAKLLDPQSGAREDDEPQEETKGPYVPPEGEDAQLLEGIYEHCQSYNRNILCIPHLDITGDKVHDLKPTLINLKVQLDTKGGGKPKLVPIPKEAVFDEYKDLQSPRSVLLSGAVGEGKTTFIKSSIHRWSKRQINETLKKEMMVYIPAVSMKGDVWDAVYNNIFCRTEEKRMKVFEFTKSGSDDVYIFLDGVDEVRDNGTLQNIQKFVETCKNNGAPVVLVSTRDNLTGVENVSFHRHLQIKGFTIEEGLEYVNKRIKDDVVMVNHLKKVRNTPEISAILRNPLRLSMLCVALEQELVQHKDIAHLTISHLYDCIEGLVHAREQRKSKSPAIPKKNHRDFYQMCLYSVLCGKVAITKDLLNMFQIEETCSQLRLLHKTCAGMKKTGEYEYIYTAPHESYLEYYASKGIMSLDEELRRLVLMFLCTKVEWFNFMAMTCGIMALREDQDSVTQIAEITSFIRCMIVLIPERAATPQDPSLLSLQKTGQDLTKSMQTLLEGRNWMGRNKMSTKNCTPELLSQVGELHEAIAQIFEKEHEVIRDQGWFNSLYGSLLPKVTTIHLHRCVEQSLPSQIAQVADNTFGKILPCQDDGKIYYHIPGTARWGHIDQDHDIYAWIPADAQVILESWTSDPRPAPPSPQQPNTQIQTPTHQHKVEFKCRDYKYVFGAPTDTAFSSGSWEELLKCPTLGGYRTVKVRLHYPDFLHSQDKESDPESDHILPIVQALSSSYPQLSDTSIEVVEVEWGYILLTKLQTVLQQFDTLTQTGKLKILLNKPSIVIDEYDDDNGTREDEILRIKQSSIVSRPVWLTPKGEIIKGL